MYKAQLKIVLWVSILLSQVHNKEYLSLIKPQLSGVSKDSADCHSNSPSSIGTSTYDMVPVEKFIDVYVFNPAP